MAGSAVSAVPPLPLSSSIVDPRVGDLGPALLALADGTIFPGIAFGAALAAGGDLVVNTSQTGYQEVCTDPSYAGQVVVMTYPLIGNHGRLRSDDQSERPWLRALVVANATAAVLEDARQLATLLRESGIPAIAGIDTRALARHLRTNGSVPGIVTAPGQVDAAAALRAVRSLPRWEDEDFVGLVSPTAIVDVGDPAEGGPLVAIVDLGLKANIVRSLRRRGARVRILPHTAPLEVALASDIDGLVFSPGPGDPARLAGPVALARAAIADGRPLLGICLGHQIVGRAAGAETRRLRFGHHGAQPPGPRRRQWAGPGDGPEPRGPGRRRDAAGGEWLPGQPGQPERRLGRGPPPPGAADRDRPVPPRGCARSARRPGRLRPVCRGSREPMKPASVLILGSGPVVIGQAAEFDYAGTQACRALRAEGVRTILVNSNPATIMTDPQVADVVYLEALTVEAVEAVIVRERPEGLLAGLGGQTALNLAVELARAGVLERHNVRLVGTPLEAIEMAEDRQRFRELLDRIGQPYAPSAIVDGATEADRLASADRALGEIGLPAIVRPAFTLGGTGGGIVETEAAYRERIRAGLRASPIGQVMVERCLVGWGEIEYEVMRDADDTCIAVCSMENVDPLGVHTGDSIVVAPVQTLPDAVHQRLRSAALAIIRALGVEGGCNVQFALSPDYADYAVIEVNPRVSRSSALASKATGYPIARVAAQIAAGRRLAEIPNVVTGTTVAAFEPALDYVVVKLPRFPFDKFPWRIAPWAAR